MSYLKERQEKAEKQRAEALKRASIQRDEYLAKMSNPESNVDELAQAIRWFFLPLASLWVGYLGYIYCENELQGVVEPWQGTLLAFTLPVFVQAVKLFGAKKALRAFHFKWYDKSAQDMWFWAGTGVLVFIMFGWSLKISVFDVTTTAKDKFLASNSDTLDVMIKSATAEIDAQIEALNAENESAQAMKTKRGTIAWSGQQIKMNNAGALASLQAQRAQITEQVLSDYKSTKLEKGKTAQQRGNFFQRFGGFGEVLEILMLVLLGLVEAINRNNNAARLGIVEDDKEKEGQTPHAQPLEHKVFQSNGSGNYNQFRPIGFRWDSYGQQPVTSVPHIVHPVSQVSQGNPVVIGSNQILLQFRTKLMADIPNLVRKNGNPSTVSARINAAFESAYEAICHPDFSPSIDVGHKVFTYLNTEAIPMLNKEGRPYPKSDFFLQKLHSVITDSCIKE